MPSDASTQAKTLSPALLTLTFPHVRLALWSRRAALIALLAVSVALGVIPTLKSELESGVVEEISQNIQRRPPLREAFSQPIERFRSGDSSGANGIIERIARIVFSQVSLLEGLGIYLLIGAAGFGLELASTRASAGVGVEMFRRLRLEGLRRGLEAEPGAIQSMPNTPGQFTAAIQQGATNASSTYEYLLEAAQQSVSVITVIVLLASRSVWFSIGCIVLVSGQVAISAVTMVGSSGESTRTGDMPEQPWSSSQAARGRARVKQPRMPRIDLCDAGCRNTSADNRPYPGDAAHRY